MVGTEAPFGLRRTASGGGPIPLCGAANVAGGCADEGVVDAPAIFFSAARSIHVDEFRRRGRSRWSVGRRQGPLRREDASSTWIDAPGDLRLAILVEVMARAKHRTKRELVRLVRVLDPLPPVPARIEPLGPALARVSTAATWEKFVGSLDPVRELEPGERPREWGETGEVVEGDPPASDADADVPAADAGVDVPATDVDVDADVPALARVDDGLLRDLGPQLYKVVFTATEEYVRLVEEAKALLSHAAPRATFEEVQLRAMRAFVETLRKRKYGTKEAPGEANQTSDSQAPTTDSQVPPEARRRGRYIPVAVRRAVAARDHQRCTYVDSTGRRCSETQRLEFHHVVPFALRASHEVSNLTLRCHAHNALAAEEDFGREFVDEKRSDERHESFATYVFARNSAYSPGL